MYSAPDSGRFVGAEPSRRRIAHRVGSYLKRLNSPSITTFTKPSDISEAGVKFTSTLIREICGSRALSAKDRPQGGLLLQETEQSVYYYFHTTE
jgi:hypothetical protein